MTLDLHATPEEVMRAVEALQEFAHAQGGAGKSIFGLALALEECGSNIVNHALQRDAQQTFQVTMESHRRHLCHRIARSGSGLRSHARRSPRAPVRRRCLARRWGIQLVRRHHG
jgi:anti-sigma regulatory factor (Ser/Thr protein kinase)